MKRSHAIVYSLTLFLLFSLPVRAQSQKAEMKRFAKEGLAFDYPVIWTLEDRSQEKAQHLILIRGSSGAQIMFIVQRETITTPDQQAAARRAMTEPLIEAMEKEFERLGARPERSTATIAVGGAQAEGVRLRAVLDGVPGSAEVYSLLLGGRVVALTLIGSDTELKAAAVDWETIRRSVKVEATTTPAKSEKQAN